MRLLKNLFHNSLLRNTPLMLLLLLAASLAGCSTLTTATAKANLAEACALYGNPINYSGSKDTAETVRQILVKNKTFAGVGCYDKVMAATSKVLGN